MVLDAGIHQQHGGARVGPFGGGAGEPKNGSPGRCGGRRRLTTTNITRGHCGRYDRFFRGLRGEEGQSARALARGSESCSTKPQVRVSGSAAKILQAWREWGASEVVGRRSNSSRISIANDGRGLQLLLTLGLANIISLSGTTAGTNQRSTLHLHSHGVFARFHHHHVAIQRGPVERSLPLRTRTCSGTYKSSVCGGWGERSSAILRTAVLLSPSLRFKKSVQRRLPRIGVR